MSSYPRPISAGLPATRPAPPAYRPQPPSAAPHRPAAPNLAPHPRASAQPLASSTLQRRAAGQTAATVTVPSVYRPSPPSLATAARPGVLQRRASAPPRAVPRMLVPRAIQRCVSCGHNDCIYGEKCKYDRSQQGLFSASATSSAKGVLPYNSSNAKAQSGKAFGTELEHVIPGAALRQMGEGGGYRYEYTVPLPKEVHRNGVGGAGGGISSTGSSHTAKGWATHLATQASEYDVVRLALTEAINAMLMNHAFTEAMAVQYSDWLTAQYVAEGRITQAELGLLRNTLMDRFYRQG